MLLSNPRKGKTTTLGVIQEKRVVTQALPFGFSQYKGKGRGRGVCKTQFVCTCASLSIQLLHYDCGTTNLAADVLLHQQLLQQQRMLKRLFQKRSLFEHSFDCWCEHGLHAIRCLRPGLKSTFAPAMLPFTAAGAACEQTDKM